MQNSHEAPAWSYQVLGAGDVTIDILCFQEHVPWL